MDTTYARSETPEDLHVDIMHVDIMHFDIIGWNSSYTGEPIPAEEMRIWVEQTTARLRALLRGSDRVLEIGCGTGMLLGRLAGSCESYVGLDFFHRRAGASREPVGRARRSAACRITPRFRHTSFRS